MPNTSTEHIPIRNPGGTSTSQRFHYIYGKQISFLILVINQLNAHNLFFYNKFIMFRALCAHHQEVKIVLYSIWYHQTCRWPSRAQVFSQPVHGSVTYKCVDTRCCI